jgi:peptidoglycan/LPS O-acetylase OafA/YrhL
VHMRMRFSGSQSGDWVRWANFVSLYFVLSGFILTYVYASRLELAKWRFLLARIARLWPAHVTAIVLMWLAAPDAVAAKFTLGKLTATLAMMHAWLPIPDYWVSFVPAAWSISTEFGFYLCFPFLVYKWERTWLWKLAASFILLCGVILLLEAEHAPLVRWMGRYWRFWLYVHPLSRLFEFTLGMATFQLWRRFAPKLKSGGIAGTLWECLALVFLLFSLWQGPAWAAQVAKSRFFGSELISLWLMAGSSCFGSAALIFVLALEQGLIARLLSYSFAVLLGELSYAIYLIHQAVLLFFWTHRKDFVAIPLWATSAIISLIILAMAYLIWAVIERPCRHFLLNLWPAPVNATVVELPASMIRPKGVMSSAGSAIVLPSKRGILIASSVLLVLVLLVTLLRAVGT